MPKVAAFTITIVRIKLLIIINMCQEYSGKLSHSLNIVTAKTTTTGFKTLAGERRLLWLARLVHGKVLWWWIISLSRQKSISHNWTSTFTSRHLPVPVMCHRYSFDMIIYVPLDIKTKHNNNQSHLCAWCYESVTCRCNPFWLDVFRYDQCKNSTHHNRY